MALDTEKLLKLSGKDEKVEFFKVDHILRWISFIPVSLLIAIINYGILFAIFNKGTCMGEVTSFYIFTLYSILIVPKHKRLTALISTILFGILETVGYIIIFNQGTQTESIKRGVVFLAILIIASLYMLIAKKYNRWAPWAFGFCSGLLGFMIIALHTFIAHKFFRKDMNLFLSELNYFEVDKETQENKIKNNDNIQINSVLQSKQGTRKYIIIEKINRNIKKIKLPNFKIPKIKLTNNATFIIIAFIIASAYLLNEHQRIVYKEKLRHEEIQTLEKQKDAYKQCMADAYSNYTYNWNETCKALGHKKDCLLPSYNADNQEKRKLEAEKKCMEKYKNKMFDTDNTFNWDNYEDVPDKKQVNTFGFVPDVSQ